MNWRIVSLEKAQAQPWRNGGGVTRELLAWPQAADWRVRASVADVQADGPFSSFEGIERWFAVLEGEGVVLRLAGEEHRLTRSSDPFRFDGAAAVDCTLPAGPTRDFNLMAPPGRARLRRLRGGEQVRVDGPHLLALYTHETPASLRMAGGTMVVPAYHLAWCLVDTSTDLAVEADNALWMEVSA